ncbi:ferrous iron transport protein B [Ferrimonas sediminicola]|uniref:Ferrous iron transport protein B n=1 Tax=Ferrimonas sediminicola TaxID=2569538 RepID=A0A4U1BCM7_9GAMM|nr:ferrous iron transport protein B [Ferrimonas sediminicola]TKB48255.1 ferrous iron transport protein B [Ferrimonas sediminicola]
MSKVLRCVAVGNPNSGKSTLFNALTGNNVSVGNWAGVTVDKKVGKLTLADQPVEITDLPGLYDLEAADGEGFIDEKISRDYLLGQGIDLLINVVDVSQLERNLYLTTQLRELNVPMLLVLNKGDVTERRGVQVDTAALEKRLGCKVVQISAKNESGPKLVKEAMVELASRGDTSQPLAIDLGAEVEQALAELGGSRASAITRLLAQGDDAALQASNKLVAQDITPAEHIADRRYQFIGELVSAVVSKPSVIDSMTEKLDHYALSPMTGVPIFLGMMYLTFMFAINVGASFIDFFDIVAGAIFVDGTALLLESAGMPDWLGAILADGVGAGIQTVATFIPVVAFLYIALSILEVSGYLARAGFVIEGVMQRIGLPGKAFVPLIVGFGCNVPAVTATRALDTKRERIVTAMMAPFMSCGARLPVYALFVAAFFPDNGQNLVFALYLIGIVAAILTGLLLRHTLLPGDASQGFMELPDYEMPTLGAIGRRTWQRTKQFVLGAGKTIVIVVTILSFFNSMGTDGSFGNQDSEKSVLSAAAQIVTPVFDPMGVKEENWPATVGVITGIFAKEAVVGTLNSLYSQGAEEEAGEFSLLGAVNEGLATIPENLFGIAWDDPLSLNIGDAKDVDTMGEEFGFEAATLKNLKSQFETGAAAFAYLLFILMYTPCAAVLGAMAGEFGARWTAFSAVYTFVVAYATATLFYQASRLAVEPGHALFHIGIILVLLVAGITYLRKLGKRSQMGVGDIPVAIKE